MLEHFTRSMYSRYFSKFDHYNEVCREEHKAFSQELRVQLENVFHFQFGVLAVEKETTQPCWIANSCLYQLEMFKPPALLLVIYRESDGENNWTQNCTINVTFSNKCKTKKFSPATYPGKENNVSTVSCMFDKDSFGHPICGHLFPSKYVTFTTIDCDGGGHIYSMNICVY